MIMRYKKYLPIGLIIMLLPLFWLNVNGFHDWGDDFAQYIRHAENIINGESYSNTSYIYIEENKMIGPPAYPIGFPVLLSPVVAVFGNNILTMQYYMSFWLILFSILIFFFIRKQTTEPWAFLIALFIAYNHWILHFKDEIMADLPFSVFIILILIVLQKGYKQKYLNFVLLSSLSVLAILIKESGYFIPLAFFILLILSFFKINIKNAESFTNLPALYRIISVFSMFFIPFAINKWLIDLQSTGAYLSIWKISEFQEIITTNLIYYSKVLIYFFSPFNEDLEFVVIWLSAGAITFILLGIVRRFIKSLGVFDILFLCYLAMIITYPYVGSGFRFLVPIIPFLLLYLVDGLKSINLNLKVKWQYGFVILFLILILINYRTVSDLIKYRNYIGEGPQQKESIEVFKFIESKTDKNSTFMFFKPRAFALYNNSHVIGEMNGDSDLVISLLDKYSVVYILLSKNNSKPEIKKVASQWKQIFSNNSFILYINPKPD